MTELSTLLSTKSAEPKLRILILEDLPSDLDLLLHELRRSKLPFTAYCIETEEEFLQALNEFNPDLILADYSLPTFDGMTALALAQQRLPDVPFLFVSATLGEELAIDTLKSGATDYVLKQRLGRLIPSVKRALREARERKERRRAEKNLELSLEQLRALATHLQFIREEERSLIAREIHDELGQSLTGLKFDLFRLESMLATADSSSLQMCRDKVQSMLELINSVIQIGRKIATELRPGILDDLGLVDALEWQAQEFQARTGIKCEFSALPEKLTLDSNRSTSLFRIFQETLTNVARHAQADLIQTDLQTQAGELHLTIQDNGRGITEEELNNPHSLGLLGMRERVMVFGGDIRISGQCGKGTTVTVRLPL